jgi:CubicO group peptidase (beta-lactamase class C family)
MSPGEPAIPAAPAAVTIDARADSRLADAAERLATILDDAVDGGYPAGATLVVADANGGLFKITGGWSCTVGEQIATSQITRYDLASLTKVVCTVPLVVALAERGVWDLDDALVGRLDGFPNPDVTLRQLLTHSSGLPAHREFYRLPGGPAAIREAVFAEASAALRAGEVCYSDLGFMLLGWAVEQCAQAPLDELFQTIVASPLEMNTTRFRPPPSEREITAATELDGDQRLEPGLVWGEVHDGNAWALGGVAGHAGLFGPAEDLVRYVGALLTPEAHPLLSAESIAEMTRLQAGAQPDTRALGWRLDAGDWGAWPERTFWHTGFTGTSLLIAPDLGVAVVLLMGGVHPKRHPERQLELRATVHREILGALT